MILIEWLGLLVSGQFDLMISWSDSVVQLTSLFDPSTRNDRVDKIWLGNWRWVSCLQWNVLTYSSTYQLINNTQYSLFNCFVSFLSAFNQTFHVDEEEQY